MSDSDSMLQHSIAVVVEVVAAADHIAVGNHRAVVGIDRDEILLDIVEGTEEEEEEEVHNQLHKHLVVVATLLVVEEKSSTD